MKKVDIKITTYEIEDDFFVEVSEFENDIEFFIYHRAYGVKEFMFGMHKAYINEENTIENLIKGNFDDCQRTYIQNYML